MSDKRSRTDGHAPTGSERERLRTEITLEVPFHDVDAMGVAWHGHYTKYFELARCALLRTIGYDYPEMRASGYIWPIVECHAKYIRPAGYGHRLRVCAELLEFENRLKIGYLISDDITAEKLTKGHTVQVAVDEKTRELQFVSPAILLEKLRNAC